MTADTEAPETPARSSSASSPERPSALGVTAVNAGLLGTVGLLGVATAFGPAGLLVTGVGVGGVVAARYLSKSRRAGGLGRGGSLTRSGTLSRGRFPMGLGSPGGKGRMPGGFGKIPKSGNGGGKRGRGKGLGGLFPKRAKNSSGRGSGPGGFGSGRGAGSGARRGHHGSGSAQRRGHAAGRSGSGGRGSAGRGSYGSLGRGAGGRSGSPRASRGNRRSSLWGTAKKANAALRAFEKSASPPGSRGRGAETLNRPKRQPSHRSARGSETMRRNPGARSGSAPRVAGGETLRRAPRGRSRSRSGMRGWWQSLPFLGKQDEKKDEKDSASPRGGETFTQGTNQASAKTPRGGEAHQRSRPRRAPASGTRSAPRSQTPRPPRATPPPRASGTYRHGPITDTDPMRVRSQRMPAPPPPAHSATPMHIPTTQPKEITAVTSAYTEEGAVPDFEPVIESFGMAMADCRPRSLYQGEELYDAFKDLFERMAAAVQGIGTEMAEEFPFEPDEVQFWDGISDTLGALGEATDEAQAGYKADRAAEYERNESEDDRLDAYDRTVNREQ